MLIQGETGTNLTTEYYPGLWRSRTRFSTPRKTIVPNQAPTKIHDRLLDCSSCIILTPFAMYHMLNLDCSSITTFRSINKTFPHDIIVPRSSEFLVALYYMFSKRRQCFCRNRHSR